MAYVNPDALVSTEWLAERLTAPDIRIVDATWSPPGGPDAKAAFNEQHIPGAVYFDIDDVAADPRGDLPHMMPDAVKFSSKVRKLGIGDGNRIVVYAQGGIASAAARVWWMLRHFGHTDVAVLDGGLPKWLAEGRPTEDLPNVPRERHFTARANSFLLRQIDQIEANVETGREQVVDARAAERFEGKIIDQWGDTGHIPGSRNLPFTDLLTADGTMADADTIKAKFAEAGVDIDKPVVTSCGSGVTACVLALGLYLVGKKEVAVFDGSWAEWVRTEGTPKETGPAA